MSRFYRLLLFASFFYFLTSCANQKILYPNPKIAFDINALDKEGLVGEVGSKVAVDYEFCIPANNRFINEVRQIDPSVRIHKKSKGRVGCGKAEWLCIGNSHQEYARAKIQRLADLSFIKRIQRTYFE
ncbi:MAG: hypothetical protein AAF960_10430 [Bacteroidota bacterium]